MESFRDFMRRIKSERKEIPGEQIRARRENLYTPHFRKLLEITSRAMKEEKVGIINVTKSSNQDSVSKDLIRLVLTTSEDFTLFDQLVNQKAVVFFENHKRIGEKDKDIYSELYHHMRAECVYIATDVQKT
ncbi:MAG: hypothetical protein M1268_02405 [Patescibacteria group bacterium]|nr:hypothetical protein [Patescibacteria group bacterium]